MRSERITAEAVAKALDPNAKKAGMSWRVPCPAHGGTGPNLAVMDREGHDGVSFVCFSKGCDARLIHRACWDLGIETGSKASYQKPDVVKNYVYRFYSGEWSGGVKQRWGRPDGAALPKSAPKTTWSSAVTVGDGEYTIISREKPKAWPYDVAYMGHRLKDEDLVLVVEGEKDCETAWDRFLPAIGIGTTFKWSDETRDLLTGRRLVLVPDNDAAGHKAMERFGLEAVRAGIGVSWLDLPGVGPKGDLTDWFDGGGTAERLRGLIKTAPEMEEEDLGWRTRLEWTQDGGIVKSTYNAQILLRYATGLRGRAQYDDFLGRTLWDGEPVDMDDIMAECRDAMFQLVGFSTGSDAPLEKVFKGVAKTRRYDSLMEHVEALPPWDGVERVDTWLEAYCGCGEPSAGPFGRVFLLGMIWRAMVPGSKFDTALVLEGGQGIGKSSVCRILGGPFYRSSMPKLRNQNDRDPILALAGNWLVEDAEMDAATKAEVRSLKAFLSIETDVVTLKRANENERRPRRCVFVITTNQHGAYIEDETGGRRFLPVHCGETIDLDGLERDRDQLLAEAFLRYQLGEEPVLMPDEYAIQTGAVRDRSVFESGPLRELIDRYIAQAPNGKRDVWDERETPLNELHVPTFWEEMRRINATTWCSNDRHFAVEIAKYMEHMGWKKERPVLANGTRPNVWRAKNWSVKFNHSNL